MLIVDETPYIEKSILNNIAGIIEKTQDVTADRVCVFDIESTGLSSRVSNLYLIGMAYCRDGVTYLTQIFADDYVSEENILRTFVDRLESFDAVVSFNGTTFDIPYIEDKCAKYGIPSPFVRTESIDLYKIVSQKRYIFPTENCKLVSIEKFIGFDRGDDSDGGECISIYTEYMQHKFARRTDKQDECYKTLLKHNKDDVIGTLLATQVIGYIDHISGEVSVSTDEEYVTIEDRLPEGIYYPTGLEYNFVTESSRRKKNMLTHRRIISDEDNYISQAPFFVYLGDRLILKIPIEEGTKYHYYKDYKNYYYLPDEDMAIHKSVGTYVDSKHRKQATAGNCYTKKEGRFLMVPVKEFEGFTEFMDRNKSFSYIDIDEFNKYCLESDNNNHKIKNIIDEYLRMH